MKPILLFVINGNANFLSHRLALAKEAMKNGYDVHVATPEKNKLELIRSFGFKTHSIALKRKSLNPLVEIMTIISLIRLYRKLKPTLVHHVAMKPTIYGSIACRILKLKHTVNLITGLGLLYSSGNFRYAILRKLVNRSLKASLYYSSAKTIFQNTDDMTYFLKRKLIKPEQAFLIKGSGVDTEEYSPAGEANDVPLIVLPARMLWDKGVGDFVDAAKQLRCSKARFALVGDVDAGNDNSVPRVQLQKWVDEGVVEWWGWRDDIKTVIKESHIVCLPSCYGEGVPKVLLEAAALSRPVVTTDNPGCKEVVIEGKNGYIVPVKSPNKLAKALEKLIDDSLLRQKMGQAGRDLVERRFSSRLVINDTMKIYANCLQ